MADDSINLEVVLSAHTQGLRGAEKDLSLIQDAVDALNRRVGLTPSVMNKASDAISRMGKTASSSAKNIKDMAPEFREVHREVEAMNKALREQAQIAAARGSQTPRAGAMQAVNFNEKDAQLVERYNEAMRTDGTRAAQQFRNAQEGAANAARVTTGAIQNQTAHLPRLRYALHDVSNQLLVIGGAMTAFSVLAFKSAIDYERSFANVIRTNDSLMNSQVAANRMFQEFIDLAGEIPTSFGDLSEIGALAGQLNIPTHALRDFTEAVAMFSATTGESIDTTATAFGRLDALLPGIQGNFQALGSSILNVGINSVATEGEIIKITTQLAGIGSQAGLTYDELIGLSGALASVGIQPELSRGTITRLFGQISRSITLGGESLQEFAKISGQSADQFASQWASEPMEAVVGILQGLNARGGEAEAALRAVGITSVRDVPAILRLAQTVDTILVPALGDAADGANEASQLADNYGVIAETVASKLQILTNNFQSLMAVMGDSTGLFAGALDILNGFLTWARELMDNPVTAFFAQLTVGITALSGVALVLLAGVTRAAAGVLAFRTAMAEAGVQATGFRAQLTGLIGTIAGVDAASVRASGNMGKLTAAMRGASVAGLALVAVPLAAWFRDWVAELNNAVIDTNTLVASISQLSPDISDSLSEDIQAVVTKSLESLGASTQTAADSAFIPIVGAYVESVRKASYEAETEFGLGLERLGMRATNFWTTNIFTGDATMWAGFFDSSYEELDKFQEAWIQAWESASSESQKQAMLDSLMELEAQVVAAGGSSEDFRHNLADLFDVIGDGVDMTALLGEVVSQVEGDFEGLHDTLIQIVDEVFASVNAQAALSDSMAQLGEDYVNLGAAAAFSGESIQDAIKQIIDQSGSASAAAANLQVFYDFILANSSATASDLLLVAQAQRLLFEQAGRKVSAPTLATSDFQAFAASADKARAALSRTSGASRGAGRAVRETAKEVRTLTDYASDLASVWRRAFDIRFSSQSTLDQITSSFISIREAAEEAARRIRDLKNDIQGLSSDIDIQEYFLSIAVEYGDTKRAEAIEAELAKMRAELADKTQDLQKEQDAASKSLKGNSKGAIENRKTIQNLVQQYQGHIEALAASGMSQAQLAQATARLKADFMAQATQLGYNSSELQVYARAFDDVTVAIRNVPRNITVAANTNPALQALNEFAARAKTIGDQAGRNFGNSFGGGANAAMTSKANSMNFMSRYSIAIAQASVLALRAALSRSPFEAISLTAQAISRQAEAAALRRAGGFQQGGFTGRGGASQVAGVVHRGEYVLPQSMVNQNTGMPYADALGRLMGGLPSRSVAPAASSSGSGSAPTVALTAGTIQAIGQATSKQIVLDGKVLADSSANVYSAENAVGRN